MQLLFFGMLQPFFCFPCAVAQQEGTYKGVYKEAAIVQSDGMGSDHFSLQPGNPFFKHRNWFETTFFMKKHILQPFLPTPRDPFVI